MLPPDDRQLLNLSADSTAHCVFHLIWAWASGTRTKLQIMKQTTASMVRMRVMAITFDET